MHILFSLFILLLLIIFIFCLVRIYFRDSFLPCLPLYIVKRLVRTGDVVAYTQTGFRGRLVKIFSKEAWVHLGILWRRNDNVYVIEFFNDKPKDTNEFYKIRTIEEWCYINHYRTLGVLFTGQRTKDITDTEFIKSIIKYAHVKIDNNVPKIWLRSFNKVFNIKKEFCIRERMSCSEFVTHVLQDLEIIDKNFCACTYMPWEIFLLKAKGFKQIIIETNNLLCM